jgi:formylglycine-generating enzyme required for sulfatase activity
MAEHYRYAAFISYSSKDAVFARRLHRALESYGIPSSLGKFDLIGGGKRNRIYPVFRDREELSAGHLGDQIEANLKASAALIVVCSPNGAASPWVQKEIEFFAAQGRPGRIFAIIPDTAPLSDEQGVDATQSCFPPAFRGDALAGNSLEPLAADARKGKDGFRNAWLKIVAGLIGVTPGQIIDRDKRRRRQQAMTAAVAWTVAALALGYAYTQRSTAEFLWTSWTRYRPYVVTDAALQGAPPRTVFQDCRAGSTDCPRMVVVQEGAVLAAPANPSEEARAIAIGRFSVSQNEITFAEWNACVRGGGCDGYEPDRNGWEGDNRPVINVSWEDAQKYVNWLSQTTGQHYRLLTELEWEYAARAVGSATAPQTMYSWGDEPPVCDPTAPNGAPVGQFCTEGRENESSVVSVVADLFSEEGNRNKDRPFVAGSFRPNAFGLHNMHGNVWEWVDGCPASRSDNTCRFRVMRGGGRGDTPNSEMTSATRQYVRDGDHYRASNVGFRIARSAAM